MMRFITALAAVAVLFTTAPLHAESTLQTVLKRKQFIAGIVADSPPSAYVDAQGHNVGYCADIARYLARRLGVPLQFVQVTATSRVPLLQTGRIDAEVSVTTPNKVRNEVVDFTFSYIFDNGVLVVREGDSVNLKGYQNADKVMGATQGNGFVDRWKLLSPNAKFKLFQDESDVVVALKKKDIDGYITGSFAAHRFAKAGGPDNRSGLGVVARCDHGARGRFKMAQLAQLGAAAHVDRGHAAKALRQVVRVRA
jgi:polar amino acid transport system substrate-binding protein